VVPDYHLKEGRCNELVVIIGSSAAGVGARLRTIRQKWQLSLREVETRSLRLAKDRNNPSYQISAGWLNRLERKEHELTVNKLLALSEIYNFSIDHLLRFIYSADDSALAASPVPHPLDETTLLSPDISVSSSYLRAILGKKDRSSEPMIPAGSIIYIDTKSRAISSRKDWTHEFQRPIYLLKTRDEFVCGWCEIDKASEWLTVIAHPLSPTSSSRWRHPAEIACVGRVVAAAIRVAA
jgi:transcriptional regulator with XRE-family HTH domain